VERITPHQSPAQIEQNSIEHYPSIGYQVSIIALIQMDFDEDDPSPILKSHGDDSSLLTSYIDS